MIGIMLSEGKRDYSTLLRGHNWDRAGTIGHGCDGKI